MYKNIIVAVDCSALEKAERIFRKAKALLDEDGEIVLLTVIENIPGYMTVDMPPVNFLEEARRECRQRLMQLRDSIGIAADIELRRGRPAHEIIEACGERGADLVIVASHIPGFSSYLIGATADRVVRHCGCSVLVDRQPDEGDSD